VNFEQTLLTVDLVDARNSLPALTDPEGRIGANCSRVNSPETLCALIVWKFVSSKRVM
jgi:hypothetical protein